MRMIAMKRRRRLPICVIVIVLLAGIMSATCRAAETLTADGYGILKVCEGVIRLSENHHEDIWPGYNLAERPFIVYVPEKWVFLFNCSHDVEGFGPYPEGWPDLKTRALYRRGTYRNLVGQLAFNVEVDTLVTFAVGLPEKFTETFDNPELAVFGYIMHEGFHQFQRDSFGEIPWTREELYPIQDIENSALSFLEMVILLDALEAMRADDRGRCLELITLFVAVRNRRWNRAAPFVATYEQGQEINEGTAKYVELKSIYLMADFQYESNLQGLVKPLTESFESISMPDHLIYEFHNRMKEGFVSPEDMPRNRIYPVGSAQGFLLDYLGIDWKVTAQEAGPGFTYAALFLNRLDMREGEFERLVDEAKNRYGYEHILAATSTSIDEYLAGYHKELAAFHGQTGYRIELDFSYTSISRSRMSRAKKWIVDNGTRTLCNYFDVYTLENNYLSLQLHKRGVLEKNDWDEKKKAVVFYAAAIDTVLLDGGAIPMNEDFQHTFEAIELFGHNVHFSAHTPGAVTAAGRNIKITLR